MTGVTGGGDTQLPLPSLVCPVGHVGSCGSRQVPKVDGVEPRHTRPFAQNHPHKAGFFVPPQVFPSGDL